MLTTTAKSSNKCRDAGHPIAVGKTVMVIGINKKRAFIDGLATVKERALGDHRYKIRFVGDPRIRERVVHPIYQRDAAGAVEWLNALLDDSAQTDFSDFFPDDL